MASLGARIMRNIAPPAPDLDNDAVAEVLPIRATSAPYSVDRAMTASAEKIDLKKSSDRADLADRPWAIWQRDAWEYLDAIAEIKYAYTLLSAVMSRLRIYAALNVDPESPPASTLSLRRRVVGQNADEQNTDRREELSAPAGATDEVMSYMEDLVRDLGSGPGGMPGLFRSFALNISVAGECYLCKIDGTWSFRSTEEIVIRKTDGVAVLQTMRSGVSRATGSSARQKELPKKTYIGRIWKSHPRYSGEPDSAMLGLREMCDELLTLQRMIRMIARSKMNAGMLFVPDGISAASTSPTATIEEAEQEADPFEQELMLGIIDPVGDESSVSSIMPSVVRGAGDLGQQIRYLTFDRKADKDLVDRADRALERILQGIDVPKDIVTGLANVKYCASADTEILTRTGWKTHDQLMTDDEVLTLNTTTKLSEWQPVKRVNRFDVIDEEMRKIESRGHSSLTTMDHRWPMLTPGNEIDWTTSRRLMAKHSIMNSASSADLPIESKYSDDFVEMIAWLQSEGCFASENRGKRRWASIAQSYSANPVHHDRIRDLLTRLFGPPSVARSYSDAAAARDSGPRWLVKIDSSGNPYYFHLNEEIIQTFENVFVPGKNKVIDRAFIYSLTRSQLELFVQTLSWGDGCGKTLVGSVYGQNDEERLENFELACHLLGLPVARRANGSSYGTNGKRWWDVRVKMRKTVWAYRSKDSVETYTGVVWCPTTENQTWFARRNGTYYFTGNSNAVQIDESLYKSHIEPLALLLVDALTKIYLIPALKAKFPGLGEDVLDTAVIWYDPTEVVTKPDAASAAGRLYDAMELSGAALRRANGFNDTDAPSENELANRLAMKQVAPPDVATALIKHYLPDIFKNAQQQAAAGNVPESAQSMLYPDANSTSDQEPTPEFTSGPDAPNPTDEAAQPFESQP